MLKKDITGGDVRLIDENGSANVLPYETVSKMADEQELDIIVLNSNVDIPVVKLGDYKAYMYNLEKKKKEKVKKARENSLDEKEIQLGTSIAEHDLMIKAKKIDKMLAKGSRIKLVIRYRGREMASIKNGPKKLEYMTEKLESKFKIESPAKIAGNQVIMVITSSK